MCWLVRTSKDLGGRPPLASRCISLSWLFFHGGNTGSNPVGDANVTESSKNRQSVRFITVLNGPKNSFLCPGANPSVIERLNLLHDPFIQSRVTSTLDAVAAEVDAPLGLGSRKIAAANMSALTEAITK
jgi:hypothetical protein